jgi:hypothetical protein
MKHENPKTSAAIRVLKELSEIASEASLTGMLQGGQKRAIERFNEVISWLKAENLLPPFGYSPLLETSSYAELAVEARLVGSQLKDMATSSPSSVDMSVLTRLAPFVDSEDLRDLIREATRGGETISPDKLAQLAPFLDRESLSSLIKGSFRTVPTPPTPEAPAPSKAPEPVVSVDFAPADPVEVPNQVQLLSLASRLADASLTHEERSAILIEINRISSR